ncbi:dephospho-CoA kinase [Yeosuana sp. MJ-SS3]|uniref:Dephospho-CoA kinase n=1 Tax=Gilvirhabdus luticola TaxID=3079858 RepID=A0ABU3UA86_9FLAO|nr:dephospho-CoA kinase [Yeosuana sp. MJ-SS3]MDU8887301.1 dephospho-CoA kinase [Yeosuana sp. MJ-SS3]
MIIVGLTGGIGSGKTTVAEKFKALGIPIYIADEEAKKLMKSSKIIKRKLKSLFGEETYLNDDLNRPFIANKIFNNKDLLDKMNAIVHPRVKRHFERWLNKQTSIYVIKESAILFENNLQEQCDFVILVTAPKRLRINRLIERDYTTKEKIEAIMSNQLSDEEKIKRSDFVITNTTLESTYKQVETIHKKLLKKR